MSPLVAPILSSAAFILLTILHLLVPQLQGPIVTCLIGGLAIAATLLVSRPKDRAWILALEQALSQTAPDALTKLRSARKTRLPMITLHVLMVLALAFFTTGCISSAPIVPVTPANAAQVSSCQTTAAWHNGIVVGDFALGGGGAALGGVGAIVTDPNARTGLSIAAAIVSGITMAGAALVGFTSSNFANSHCSDVVGALPLAASKKASTP